MLAVAQMCSIQRHGLGALAGEVAQKVVEAEARAAFGSEEAAADEGIKAVAGEGKVLLPDGDYRLAVKARRED